LLPRPRYIPELAVARSSSIPEFRIRFLKRRISDAVIGTRSSRSVVAAWLVILVATAVALGQASRAPFLFDDLSAIVRNPTIARLWPAEIPLTPPANSPVAGRPASNYSLALSAALDRVIGTPGEPLGFHLMNIALHLASGLLLFGVLRRTLRHRTGGELAPASEFLALGVAAIWLLHPLQTEAVDYLTQRTELLVSFCYFAVMYCSIRAWDADPSRGGWWYVVGVVACTVGMASKEVMISAPIVVVLYDVAFRLRSWRDIATIATGRKVFYVGLAATWLLLAALVIGSPRTAAGAGELTPLDYLHTQGWAVLRYLRLVVWPVGLSVDYGMRGVGAWQGLPGLTVLAVLAVGTIRAWRTPATRWLGFCGAWFFLLLAPSSSVVPVPAEVAAERRIYLALAAVLVALVFGGAVLLRRIWPGATAAPVRRRCALGGGIMVTALAACFVLTGRRSAEYNDPEALWHGAVTVRPDNARALNNLASVIGDASTDRAAEATALFHAAVAADSSYTPALFNLSVAELQDGHFDRAEVLLRRVTTLDPDDEPALLKLGTLLFARGALEQAAVPLVRATTLVPGDADAHAALGLVELRRGDSTAANRELRTALDLDPQNAVARAAMKP
jgi:Tfp pilus assembly protein PilF